MGVGDVGERRDHALGGAAGPSSVRATSASPGPGASVPVPPRVGPRRGERRTRARGRRPGAAAAGGEQRAGAQRDRLAPGARLTAPPAPRSRLARGPVRHPRHRDRAGERQAPPAPRRSRSRSRRAAASRSSRPAATAPGRARAARAGSRSRPRARTSAITAPASSRRTAAPPAPNARSTETVRRRSWTVSAHAWISAYRQTRPSTIATARRIERSTATSGTPRPTAPVAGAAGRSERGADRAGVRARCAARPRAARRRGRRIGGEQRGRRHVGDAAVVIERADDAGDPQPQLAPRRELDRERRARRQPERLRQPEPDLGLTATAEPPARHQRRRLEHRVVAGVGDHVDRLAERVRVDGLFLVARRDRLRRRGSRARAATAEAGSYAVSW